MHFTQLCTIIYRFYFSRFYFSAGAVKHNTLLFKLTVGPMQSRIKVYSKISVEMKSSANEHYI